MNLINSPNYPLDYDYTILLRSYFSTHSRCLRLNDTFGVPSYSDLLFAWNNPLYASSPDGHCTVIYFQVCQINDTTPANLDEDYIVSPGSDLKLFKTSNINCCCPSMLTKYYHHRGSEPLVVPEAIRPEVTTLASLVRPYLLRIRSLHTGTILLTDPTGACGAKRIIHGAAQFWHLHVYKQSAIDLLCEVPQTTEAKIRHAFARASLYAPCIFLITNLDILYRSEIYRNNRILALLRSTIADFSRGDRTWPVLVVATVQQIDVDHPLTGFFLHKLNLEPMDESGRRFVLRTLVWQRLFAETFNVTRLEELVKLTAGLSVEHLESIVTESAKHFLNGQKNAEGPTEETFEKFFEVLKSKAEHYRESNLETGGGLLQVPNVSWADIGGLEEVKQEIMETIEMPLKLGIRFSALGIRRSGILLYGPPGTGKTLLAKAVASQCKMNFISVKGPELINKYVGQSEENVRNLFAQARRASPSIIFFDELDSLAPARGRSGDSGGVMDRVVSQLLTELDGISSGSSSANEKRSTEEAMVFVIGATNRLDLIDSALLRPGRFDKCLQVPVASDRESRLAILGALTKKFHFDEEKTTRQEILQTVEQASPPSMSGADFYSLCSSAMFNALRRTIAEVDRTGDTGLPEDDNVEDSTDEEKHRIIVRFEDFVHVLASAKGDLK